jgi:hypothetical protein
VSTSYNGFKSGTPDVFTPPGLDNDPIPGTDVHLEPGLHKGSIATVLFYVAEQLNARVEPAKAGECWGYADRPSKNDAQLISCHASGTAFDYNAPDHPNGAKGTFRGKVTEIRKILGEVNNLVHWGGDGWGAGTTLDEMHFEIAEGVTMMQLDELAAKLRPVPAPEPVPAPPAPAPAPAPTNQPLQYGQRSLAVRHLQEFLSTTFRAYNHYSPTGFFGDLTLAGVKEFQFRVGLVVDGIVGPRTVAALERFGYRPL